MVITGRGPVGVFVVRHAVEAGRSVSESATIHFLQMAGKIATSRGLDLAKNAPIALNGLVHWTVATMIGLRGPRVQCHVEEA